MLSSYYDTNYPLTVISIIIILDHLMHLIPIIHITLLHILLAKYINYYCQIISPAFLIEAIINFTTDLIHLNLLVALHLLCVYLNYSVYSFS